MDSLHREVLVLRFHEELSLEEIAKVTRAPLSTVKSRLYRGLAAIKPKLERALPRFQGGGVKAAGLAVKAKAGSGAGRDLLSALAGNQADRECAVAYRTRRVVKRLAGRDAGTEGRAQARPRRGAGGRFSFLVLGPLVWRAGRHPDRRGAPDRDDGPAERVIFFLSAALLASAVLAGWLRRRS